MEAMPSRLRTLVALLALLPILPACDEPKPVVYGSLAELTKAHDRGYVVLGRFGDAFPAAVKEMRVAKDEIAFRLNNGTQHVYPGYTGYKLKLVRLTAQDGRETVILFRSRAKA